ASSPGAAPRCRHRGSRRRGARRHAPASRMQFDFDPIHLQDPDGEAVSTYRELITVPEIGISSANIVAPSVAEVDEIIRRAAGLPEVSVTRSIQNLVPSDQDANL